MSSSDRMTRGCDLCGGVDNHPRHVVAVTEGGIPDQTIIDKLIDNGARGAALTEVLDATTVIHHFDCGRDSGCSICDGSLDAVPEASRHGQKLIAHLTKDF